MLQFTKHSLERLQFVIETKGKQPKVIASYEGVESFFTMAIIQRRVPLTKSRICHVFGDDKTYRGSITINESGMPVKTPEENGLTFSDYYC